MRKLNIIIIIYYVLLMLCLISAILYLVIGSFWKGVMIILLFVNAAYFIFLCILNDIHRKNGYE